MRKTLLGWAVLAVVLAGWMLWLRPVALGGGTSLIVVAGSSMEPTLMPGDLVVTRDTDSYEVGDVAVYTVPDGQPGEGSRAMIVHRLVEGTSAAGFRTQGDNLNRLDPWTPREKDIVGSMWLHWPGGGQVLLWLLQPAVVGGLFGAVTVYLLTGRRRDEDVHTPGA